MKKKLILQKTQIKTNRSRKTGWLTRSFLCLIKWLCNATICCRLRFCVRSETIHSMIHLMLKLCILFVKLLFFITYNMKQSKNKYSMRLTQFELQHCLQRRNPTPTPLPMPKHTTAQHIVKVWAIVKQWSAVAVHCACSTLPGNTRRCSPYVLAYAKRGSWQWCFVA